VLWNQQGSANGLIPCMRYPACLYVDLHLSQHVLLQAIQQCFLPVKLSIFFAKIDNSTGLCVSSRSDELLLVCSDSVMSASVLCTYEQPCKLACNAAFQQTCSCCRGDSSSGICRCQQYCVQMDNPISLHGMQQLSKIVAVAGETVAIKSVDASSTVYRWITP